ncbi:MAG: glycosyltransferase [candidate division WOR-3 bacterium]
MVSVIIDTYNYGKFIEDAIDSVLNQDFPKNEMEVIVVDDGSTDDTPERVKKYKDKIKYIYKENGGQASAINVGIENSNGEYIVLLDSDDYFHPEKIKKVVDEFERYEKLACVLNSRKIIDEINKEEKDEELPSFHNLELKRENLHFLKKLTYGTSRSSFRKNFLKNVLPIPQELKIEADLYLNLAIIWFGNFSYLNEKLTYYRIHGGNLFCLERINKLPLQINTMKIALKNVREIARRSKIYDPYILDKILKPYEIEIMEKEFLLNAFSKKAKRKEFLKMEIEKFKFYKDDWNFSYKFYKILRLPFLTLLPPKILIDLKNFYWENKYFKIRNLFFPQK